MKILLILALSILMLMANGFKYKQIIKKDTPIVEIIKIIENVQNGTVLILENGEYDFLNKTINISNKEYISLEGTHKDKTFIKNLSLSYNNSKYTQLKHLTYNDSTIQFSSNHNSYVANILLNKSQIILRSSTCYISRIISNIDYKDRLIWLDSSTVKINNSDIANKIAGAIYSKSSSLIVWNSKLSSTNYPTINSEKSYVHLYNNIFKNDNTFKSNGQVSFVDLSESKAIIHKNKFDNFKYGIRSSDQTSSTIFNNEFNRLSISIILNTKSKSRIFDNSIKNGTLSGNIGIFIYNAKALIQDNQFNFMDLAIGTLQNSKTQIAGNEISNIQNAPKYGKGIVIGKGCLSNIWDNIAFNYKPLYIGWADKESHVYLNNNDKGFSLPGLGDPQTVDNAYKFNFVDPYPDFRKDFIKIDIADFKYADLKMTNNRVIENIKTINGYLMEDISIEFNDYDDVIRKGTYIVYDTVNKIIIEPKEYKDGKILVVPKLGFSKVQRNIKVLPIFDNKRNLLKFKIESKVNIKKVYFNDNLLKYNENSKTTKARKIRNFNEELTVKLTGGVNNFSEYFDCKFDKNKIITCNPKLHL